MTIVSDSIDSAVFRRVLGHYATGVVVVAAIVDGQPSGLAVNSFTSVSLDPPLVAFCAAGASTTWPRMRRSGSFAVSVLGREQEEVCRLFARKGVDRFAGTDWETSPGGHPVLGDAMAWLDISAEQIIAAGDHELVLGRITALGAADGEPAPLLFFRGTFGTASVPAVTPSAHPADRASAARLEGLCGLDVESPFFAVLAARLGPSA